MEQFQVKGRTSSDPDAKRAGSSYHGADSAE